MRMHPLAVISTEMASALYEGSQCMVRITPEINAFAKSQEMSQSKELRAITIVTYSDY